MKLQNIIINTSSASFWQILVVLLLFVGFLTLLILFLNPESAQAEKLRTLSESVQSEMSANYSIDIARAFVPQISLSLVREIISNRVSPGEVSGEFSAFMNSLETLVPTVTPDPNMILMNPDSLKPTSTLTLTTTLTTLPTITITTTETETATPTSTTIFHPLDCYYHLYTLAHCCVYPTQQHTQATCSAHANRSAHRTEVPSTDTPEPIVTATPGLPVEPATPVPPVIPTVNQPKSPTPQPPTATIAPTATREPAPTREPKPTKVPKDTKTPKEDKSEEPINLVVPMLLTPVVIK
jgi:hypothetical protein